MFPLALLPTIPDDLNSMDSRLAIRHINAFMKNALIRGMNNVYELAPRFQTNQPEFFSFLEYAGIVFDMLHLHLEGDELFFTTLNTSTQGRALVDTLGTDCNPATPSLYHMLRNLQQKLQNWKKVPQDYSPAHLRIFLEGLGGRILPGMEKQIGSMKSTLLMKVVTDEDFREMIKDNLAWVISRSDMTYLLPFVLSHHDPQTSSYWPTVTAEGLEMVPQLLKVHAICWQFAPVDPITKKK